jgi:hypothetical protein
VKNVLSGAANRDHRVVIILSARGYFKGGLGRVEGAVEKAQRH